MAERDSVSPLGDLLIAQLDYVQAQLTFLMRSHTRMEVRLANLTNLENQEMSKLDDLETKVSEVDSVVDSAVTLIEGLRDQLAELASSDPRIQAVIDDLDARKSALAAAVAANIAPPVEPTPEPVA